MALQFLADESCDFVVVRALRAAGYDVLAIGELTQRTVDSELITLAAQEQRVLLTEDKDFGWLVFVSQAHSAGVILIRFPSNQRAALAEALLTVVREYAEKLTMSFTVVQPGYTRISPRPEI